MIEASIFSQKLKVKVDSVSTSTTSQTKEMVDRDFKIENSTAIQMMTISSYIIRASKFE